VDDELTGATTIHQKTFRTSLYNTIINNNDALDSIRRSHKQSPTIGISPPISDKSKSPVKKAERWDKNGEMSSVNHLIKYDTVSHKTSYEADRASEHYMPGRQRLFKYDNRKKTVRELDPLSPDEIIKL